MNRKTDRSIFVTVGTTEFEQLVQVIDQPKVYEAFKKYGYNKLRIAIGRGKYVPQNFGSFDVEVLRYIDDLNACYRAADLIICHCGAGTMMDCFALQKTICAVVNDTLMGNHQQELYDHLVSKKLIYGVPKVETFADDIENLLGAVDSGALQKYPIAKPNLIDKIIQQTL